MKAALAGLAFLLAACAARAEPAAIVIDPGHGGKLDAGRESDRTLSSANNASTPSGQKEKDLALELALEIQRQIALLQSGPATARVRCVLTRASDAEVDFEERARICADLDPPPAAIVSIHFNASEGHSALGTVAVVEDERRNKNYREDMAFASGLVRKANAAVARYVAGSKPREPISDSGLHDGLGSNFFFQLAKYPRLQTTPKCFLEVEFIDRKDVEGMLLANRAKAFPAIADAIARHLLERCGR